MVKLIQTQDWTSEEIDAVLAKVTEGVGWWSDLLDTLDTVHELDFVIDVGQSLFNTL